MASLVLIFSLFIYSLSLTSKLFLFQLRYTITQKFMISTQILGPLLNLLILQGCFYKMEHYIKLLKLQQKMCSFLQVVIKMHQIRLPYAQLANERMGIQT